MARFRDSAEFGPTLDAVAEDLGLSATAVEKDYWVSEVLRVLVAEFRNDFIFKGGTSLSKGFGIVERFSEDIDVLVLPGDRGRATVDKLMKAMGEAAAVGIGGEAAPFGGAETGRHRSFAVSYPASREATPLIQTSVLLEMGIRGGQHPHEAVAIGSLLGTALEEAETNLDEYEDLAPFEVLALHPARTLLEKLVHVNELAVRLAADDGLQPDRRSGRHFYDIQELLDDGRVLDLLADRDETLQVIRSIDEITHTYFGGAEGVSVRPDGGFATSPAFRSRHVGVSPTQRGLRHDDARALLRNRGAADLGADLRTRCRPRRAAVTTLGRGAPPRAHSDRNPAVADEIGLRSRGDQLDHAAPRRRTPRLRRGPLPDGRPVEGRQRHPTTHSADRRLASNRRDARGSKSRRASRGRACGVTRPSCAPGPSLTTGLGRLRLHSWSPEVAPDEAPPFAPRGGAC